MKKLFSIIDRGNFQEHTQEIAVGYLPPENNLKPKVSIQIKTTEIDHPISFRFEYSYDIENFMSAIFTAYCMLISEHVKNNGYREILINSFLKKLEKKAEAYVKPAIEI